MPTSFAMESPGAPFAMRPWQKGVVCLTVLLNVFLYIIITSRRQIQEKGKFARFGFALMIFFWQDKVCQHALSTEYCMCMCLIFCLCVVNLPKIGLWGVRLQSRHMSVLTKIGLLVVFFQMLT